MNKSCILGIGLSLIGPTGATLAQNIVPAAPATAQMLIRQLQQDAFVRPGLGFRRVQLGHGFDQVARAWGSPTRRKSTLLSSIWEYRVVNDTSVILRGGSTVDSIEVIAGFNSELQSAEGARFGMATYQVISIYGNPDKRTSNNLSYLRKGIEFGFARGGLRSIKVFAPKDK
ncbi:MAG: hypothetical protein OES09_00565 [Gammaproteobacteria bacterium]|nr:hypothetical protein [Gammaproteobacteria bacterium]